MFWIFDPQRKQRKAEADHVYNELAREALSPEFFSTYGVPDTLDGRFEITSLYIILAMRGMERRAAQALFDRFFVGVDRSLREMGIGDLSVPRHMRRMMTAFNGRRAAYGAALDSGNEVALKDALRRNLYGTLESPDPAHIEKMAAHILARAKTPQERKAA